MSDSGVPCMLKELDFLHSFRAFEDIFSNTFHEELRFHIKVFLFP